MVKKFMQEHEAWLKKAISDIKLAKKGLNEFYT